MNEIERIESLLPVQDQQIQSMLEIVKAGSGAVIKATQNFNKTQSQFMDNMLTVSHPTPLRNARQILAEMKKTKAGLAEATYSVEKQRLEIEELEKEMLSISGTKRKLAELEIAKKQYDIAQIEDNINGAIRKLANYQLQFDSILKAFNLTEFNELDFEKQEEEYHIKKAFQQALCAARSRNSMIDEGNMIYLQQIGVNGGLAQFYIQEYLLQEKNQIAEFLNNNGPKPSANLESDFLQRMYETFKGSAEPLATNKGMKTLTEQATLLS